MRSLQVTVVRNDSAAAGLRMNVVRQYSMWKAKQPDVACLFARQIAMRPDRYGQQILVAGGAPGNPKMLAHHLSMRIERLVQDPAAHAAVVLFPQLQSLNDAAATFLELKGRPKWSVSTSAVPGQGNGIGPCVAVHISRTIPFGATLCPSEALVLGPFDGFPATRRAPVVGFEIYVGEPRPLDPKTNQPTSKANLAHIEMHLPTHDAFETMWAKTQARRLISLGQIDDKRAKAKVSFDPPPILWTPMLSLERLEGVFSDQDQEEAANLHAGVQASGRGAL
jgi:hypothetical protein